MKYTVGKVTAINRTSIFIDKNSVMKYENYGEDDFGKVKNHYLSFIHHNLPVEPPCSYRTAVIREDGICLYLHNEESFKEYMKVYYR